MQEQAENNFQTMHNAFCNEFEYHCENKEAGPYYSPKVNIITFKTKCYVDVFCNFEITQTFEHCGGVEYRVIVENPQFFGSIVIESSYDFNYVFERLKALVLLFSDENIRFL